LSALISLCLRRSYVPSLTTTPSDSTPSGRSCRRGQHTLLPSFAESPEESEQLVSGAIGVLMVGSGTTLPRSSRRISTSQATAPL
jgi:hypothetical protein